MTEDKKSVILWLHQTTGCGVHEAQTALEQLIDALSHPPITIMDKPRKLNISWKNNNELE